MKKLICPLALLCFFISLTVSSQVPVYYTDGDNNYTDGDPGDVNFETLTGLALRDALAAKIINTHINELTYTPGIWEASRITDLDPDDLTATNVLLIYGYEDGINGAPIDDRTRDKNNNGGGFGEWNREHVFANSLGTPSLNSTGTNTPPYADAHNLRPCDVSKNGQRSNLLFADGSGNSGPTGPYFYPGDEWRGDVARIIMYMYLRYGAQCYPSYVGNGTPNIIDSNMIDLFLEWNAEDPVSPHEDARNDYHDSGAPYAQGNRNPFIDNPYLATIIWGGTPAEDRWGITYAAPDIEDPSIPANLMVTGTTSTTVSLSWETSIDNTGIANYDVYVNGLLNSTVASTTTTVIGLTPETIYSFQLNARDFSGNTSGLSDVVDGTTLSNVGSTTELFFSEYIEGSGNNKALEIANFTGADVDLSEYSIQRNVNGNGFWSEEYILSGILANGEVFVLGNNNADNPDILSEADVLIQQPIIFNGDDDMGLFRNGMLIDIIGDFAVFDNFAQNVTLIRNPDVNSPNTTYDPGEWTEFAQNHTADLGLHAINAPAPPSATELFFSEYIEGSGSNKALEIANFTGADVDLSEYSIQRNVNGNGFWSEEYVLSGTLTNGDVYVLGNNNADNLDILSEADVLIQQPIIFNGDDDMGLFRNGMLIDIIGDFAVFDNFAQNVTLVRNSDIIGPNTVYDLGEWTVFPINTTDNLGVHNVVLSFSIVQDDADEFKIYPNPVDTDAEITLQIPPDTSIKDIILFNSTGQQLLKIEELQPSKVKISFEKRAKGMHFLQINTNKGNITKKLIIK